MATENEVAEAQAAHWNGRGGRAWVEGQATLDAMFDSLAALLAEAVPAGSGERVLDVGCGTGATTLAIARRLGPAGSCLGLDISEPMLAAARARAGREGSGARFLRADAQRHAFEPASFDRIVSRFGVMFFDDPVRAFANLRGAARDGAGLRFLAWRSPAENPFMTTAERAAAPLLPALPPRQTGGPGQFAFAERDRVQAILEQAGWARPSIRPHDADCRLPERELLPFIGRMGVVAQALAEADAATRARVVETVRAGFEPYVFGDEVRFTAACWLVEAQA